MKWIQALSVQKRAPFIALRAFNAETSLIGDLVSQGGAPLRQMRFEWWRSSIKGIYDGKPVDHPVIQALDHCNRVQPLSKYRLLRMISAKEADQVEHQAPPTTVSLEDFAEATTSQLHYLQLEAASVQDSEADHAASHIGKAVGIANLLRGMPHFLRRGTSYLPVDLCAQHGVSLEKLYREEPSEGLQDVVQHVATVAKQHLDHAVNMHGNAHAVPLEARQTFLAGVGCRLYLEALEQYEFDVLHRGLQRGGYTPLWYLWKLKSAQWSNVY